MNSTAKTARTPGPWRTHNSGQPDNVTAIKGSDNTIIADVFGYDTVDAAFIVTACNVHDSLVTVLEMCLLRLEKADKHLNCNDEILAARAALAKAAV